MCYEMTAATRKGHSSIYDDDDNDKLVKKRNNLLPVAQNQTV
jgi:hypothetical protein